MSDTEKRPDERRFEQFLGNFLRVGVIVAATIVLIGGVIYLIRYGAKPADYREFKEEPADLRSPAGIVVGALHGHSRAIIQLGLLALIATPVLRVVFSVVGFGLERDVTYVVITLVVLAVLLYSLFGGLT